MSNRLKKRYVIQLLIHNGMVLITLPAEESFAEFKTNGATTYQNNIFGLIEELKFFTDSPITTSEALILWENCPQPVPNSLEDKKVVLREFWPPIHLMDNSLSEYLVNCEILSLSKNMIENISGLQSMTKIKILSLAQNQIKSLAGLAVLSGTLEELIIACNFIKEISEIKKLTKLRIFDISHNLISEWKEFMNLKFILSLEELTFKNNPICWRFPEDVWRQMSSRRLPQLKVLDGAPTETYRESTIC